MLKRENSSTPRREAATAWFAPFLLDSFDSLPPITVSPFRETYQCRNHVYTSNDSYDWFHLVVIGLVK